MTGALFVTNVLVWGFTWIAIAYQLDEASVEVALIYRFAVAVVTLVLVLAAISGLSISPPGWWRCCSRPRRSSTR